MDDETETAIRELYDRTVAERDRLSALGRDAAVRYDKAPDWLIERFDRALYATETLEKVLALLPRAG